MVPSLVGPFADVVGRRQVLIYTMVVSKKTDSCCCIHIHDQSGMAMDGEHRD